MGALEGPRRLSEFSLYNARERRRRSDKWAETGQHRTMRSTGPPLSGAETPEMACSRGVSSVLGKWARGDMRNAWHKKFTAVKIMATRQIETALHRQTSHAEEIAQPSDRHKNTSENKISIDSHYA